MESTNSGRRSSIRQARLLNRSWSTLVSVLLLLSPPQGVQAQAEECGVIRTAPIRVEDDTSVDVLRAAANCIDGGMLETDWAGTLTLDAPITVASGVFLSITGEEEDDGALAGARGGSQTRMFEISPGGGLTLTRLKLSGGTAAAAGGGGAIYSNSSALTLDSCVFQDNVAADGDGGAVWAEGGNVTIRGGEFSGNNASGYGGAVAASSGATSSTSTATRLVVQEGAKFEGNKALVGGAVYCSGTETTTPESGAMVVSPTTASCSLNSADFLSNTATGQTDETALFGDVSEGVDGGGAVAFRFATANITDSVFFGNYAEYSGGAVLGGSGTDVTIDGGCEFENNTAVEYGGAIAASSLTLDGGTELTNNTAASGGGAVFGWDPNGLIVFNDVVCTLNTASDGDGGCFHGSGAGIINNGTVMRDNTGINGGCIYTHEGSELDILGGDFMCRSIRRGAVIFAGDSTNVTITGGVMANSVAGTRGGAVFCSGYGESTLIVEGGTFRNNSALEYGGALSIAGELTVVQITGGVFINNTASFYGGFVYLSLGVSFSCEGASITNNYAGDQGGGIYARDSEWVNSTCDLIGNQAPQGAALYLTGVESATLENHAVTNNLALSGSVLYMTESVVVADGVSFISGVDLQEDSYNRAVQSDSSSKLTAKGCVFKGWLGDTVIYHRNSDAGSLILDRCDFSGSSATTAVFSLNSDAIIRNAVVDDSTFENAGRLENSLTLVNRALTCRDGDLCGPGECVDSALGVLCECLDADTCLDDGGGVSLRVETPPASDTYSPEGVSFELVVSSNEEGTTNVIWDLTFEADGLELDVAPSSGVLPPGGSLTVSVSGTPTGLSLGGALTSTFNLTSLGTTTSSDSVPRVTLNVDSTFYFCSAFEYAVPSANDTYGVSCEPCVSIEGGEGVNCDSPGATLASLPIRQGYWRMGQDAVVVHRCGHYEACAGATDIGSADDYCKDGYEGPFCAVCSEGYGRSVSDTCLSCDSPKARLLISASIVLSVAMILLSIFVGVLFLVGGLDTVDPLFASSATARKLSMVSTLPMTTSVTNRPVSMDGRVSSTSMTTRDVSMPGKLSSTAPLTNARNGSVSRKIPSVWPHAETTSQGRQDDPGPERSARKKYANSNIAPAFDFTWEGQLRGDDNSDNDAGDCKRESQPTIPGPVDGFDSATNVRPPSGALSSVEASIRVSDVPQKHTVHAETPVSGRAYNSAAASAGVARALVYRRAGLEIKRRNKPNGCCLGDAIKRWGSKLPVGKLKILVVVWQILASFSGITGVEFPASYATFLSWVSVVNLDIGHTFSATCVLPPLNFYARLLVTSLTPLVLAGVLVLTYRIARRRADIGWAGVIARRDAWSRHVSAGLLLTFLVYTSASTLVFKTFACDDSMGGGKSYLRADYRLSCGSTLHTFFRGYAVLMVLVYPIGIPALYAFILWKNREMLNPIGCTKAMSDASGTDEAGTRPNSVKGYNTLFSLLHTARQKRPTENDLSPRELVEYAGRVRAREGHPELTPSMFLWMDYGPDVFYYEVIECGRRLALTGLLVFVAPGSSTQVATACVFAFGSLVGFELLRPHEDPANAWLYRLGCVVIFLSFFLALLIKMDVAGEVCLSALAGLLVAINGLLVITVLFPARFTVRQSAGNACDEESSSHEG